MGKNKKQKRMGWISRFISSDKGQRFFNFAYSIGAAIVIWGALFKILHLPGGNTLLSIGMGTEVLMFLLTAFDRPPKEYKWENVFPALDGQSAKDDEEPEVAQPIVQGADTATGVSGTVIIGGYPSGGNAVTDVEYEPQQLRTQIAPPAVSDEEARQAVGLPAGIELEPEQTKSLSESISKMAAAADQLSKMAELTSATQRYLDQMGAIAEEMERLHKTTTSLNNVSEVLLKSYEAITRHSNEINESSNGYVDEMQNLNRNISGLNTIYEIQLKSVSSQLDAIDRVNRGIKDIRDMYEKSASQSTRYYEETEKMARYMQQLNSVYEKMITAMTINMYRPMMGAEPPVVAPETAKPEAPEYE